MALITLIYIGNCIFQKIYRMQNLKIFYPSGLTIVALHVTLRQVNFFLIVFHDAILKSSFEPCIYCISFSFAEIDLFILNILKSLLFCKRKTFSKL